MSVLLGQVVVVNYATTPLEATFALVTLDTFFMLKIVHAMVSCTLVITYKFNQTFICVVVTCGCLSYSHD